MPGISGMDVLDHIVQIDPAADVILMTAHYTTESVLEAIRKGACDYINKPFTREQLRERVAPVIAEARQRLRAQHLDQEMVEACRFQGIIGRSPLMREVFARARRVAPYFRTVLITGATGSGKEVLAHAMHRLSPAVKGPFVVCNCAAIPENLLESELFGHVRGAFTSATSDKAGMFEAAHGGTLFLDEIGELPIAAQAKLLRAVQTNEIQRVGSTASRKVDVRIICATNRNLQREMELRHLPRRSVFSHFNGCGIKAALAARKTGRHSFAGAPLRRSLRRAVWQENRGSHAARRDRHSAPSLGGQRPGSGKRHRLRLHDDPVQPGGCLRSSSRFPRCSGSGFGALCRSDIPR